MKYWVKLVNLLLAFVIATTMVMPTTMVLVMPTAMYARDLNGTQRPFVKCVYTKEVLSIRKKNKTYDINRYV